MDSLLVMFCVALAVVVVCLIAGLCNMARADDYDDDDDMEHGL